jgi:hypothetical protein
MESIKINRVTPQQDLDLLVEFNNGVQKKYNVGLLFYHFPEYKILEHKPLFDTVYVDCGGCSVAWTPDIDISEWELWDNGSKIDNN